MRILQLDASGDGSTLLDLHPRLSVVAGLGPAEREQLLEAAAGIVAGDAGMGGLLEAHGILLDLTPQNLELLDLRQPVVNVARAGDVPGAVDPAEVRRAVERHLLSWAPGRHPALDAARGAYEAAKQTSDALRAEASEAREALHAASARREQAQTELEHVRSDLDPFAESKLEAARAALADIEVELGVAASEPPEARVDRLRKQLAALVEELATLPAADTTAVARALQLVREPPQGGIEPDPVATQLADQVDALQSEIVAFEQSLADEGISLAKAMSDLEESRRELAEAETLLARRDPTDEERTELESVHDQIQELEPKTESRIGGAKARRQVEELLAREHEILASLGYHSWTEYIMGATLLGVDPEAQQRVERARIDVEVREGRWNRLAERLESEPEYKAMLDRLEGVYLAAFDVLKGEEPDDLSGALRALTVEVPPMTELEAAAGLWDALEDAGVELEGDELPFEAVVEAGERWLETIASAERRRPEIERELAELANRLEEAEADVAAAAAGEEPEPVVPDDPRWAAAVAKVNGAEARYKRYLEGAEHVRPLEEQMEQAVAAERAAQDALESRQARVDEASANERSTRAALDQVIDELGSDPEVAAAVEAESGIAGGGRDREELEMFLLSLLTALRGVSYAGSVPLVVDEVLDDLPPADAHEVLERLERLSDAVQVVILSSSLDVARWADGVGIERAAVVEPGAALL